MIRDAVRRYQVETISNGPASGMRVGRQYASNAYGDGAIELPVQHAIVEAVAPGDVFFDIGANVGFFTLVAAAALEGTGELHAFEARPAIAQALRRNVRRNQIEATVWPTAVGDHDGTATLHIAHHPGGSTLAASKASDVRTTMSVEVISLDSAIGDGRLPAPDVVKIDVEGSELEVLRGMIETLRSNRPVLIVEVDDQDAHEVERRFDELDVTLREVGYRCERLGQSYDSSSWNVIHFVATPHGK
jgi:FkbM family methyltransferase